MGTDDEQADVMVVGLWRDMSVRVCRIPDLTLIAKVKLCMRFIIVSILAIIYVTVVCMLGT
jgi:hypothetical protein